MLRGDIKGFCVTQGWFSASSLGILELRDNVGERRSCCAKDEEAALSPPKVALML